MKKIIIGFALLLLLLGLEHCGKTTSNDEVSSLIKTEIINTNKKFNNQIDSLILAVSKNKNPLALQQKFDTLRFTFKEMEWAVGFFTPQSNRFINGPNLDEIEYAENSIIEAEGLQTLEEFFYPQFEIDTKDETIRLLKKLKNKSTGIDIYFESNDINTSQVAEALRNEIFRITTLGITGFDTPISGKAILEVTPALNGINKTFEIFKKNKNSALPIIDEIQIQIKNIQNQTLKNYNKETFNYLQFIDIHLNKLSDLIYQFIKESNIHSLNINRPIKSEASNLFSKDAWNINFFAPSEKYYSNQEKIKLGAKLFSDNILSNDGERSCQTCHKAELAFTDGLKTPLSRNNTPLKRNTPSINYSNFQHGQF